MVISDFIRKWELKEWALLLNIIMAIVTIIVSIRALRISQINLKNSEEEKRLNRIPMFTMNNDVLENLKNETFPKFLGFNNVRINPKTKNISLTFSGTNNTFNLEKKELYFFNRIIILIKNFETGNAFNIIFKKLKIVYKKKEYKIPREYKKEVIRSGEKCYLLLNLYLNLDFNEYEAFEKKDINNGLDPARIIDLYGQLEYNDIFNNTYYQNFEMKHFELFLLKREREGFNIIKSDTIHTQK